MTKRKIKNTKYRTQFNQLTNIIFLLKWESDNNNTNWNRNRELTLIETGLEN